GAGATPSDAVDQAWHLHLTYTRDYWEHFCPDVLGRALHHGPTAGGADEHRRYYRQYAETLARYEAAFGIAPPS
ncbi:glycine-rich domain-containing protein, partial [Sphingomonas sp. CCH9-H8]|uniref:glycine-rich domain-containing protein n=1 Tax=Sphingomonas sp. CCH9-H8 TaxID=1768772 RepID=UPI000ABF47F5